MARKSKVFVNRSKRRKARPSGYKERTPPSVPSPFEPKAREGRVLKLIERIKTHAPDTRDHMSAIEDYRLLTLKDLISATIQPDRPFLRLEWPAFYYIPSDADYKQYYPWKPPPAANRYARDWTNGIGASTAKKGDGSLFAWAMSPTIKGAIDGAAEAGLGILFTPKHTLSRVRVEPDLAFTGRHKWGVDADPVVSVSTRVIGTIFVGGFELNPVTGGFEAVPNFIWRRHLIFDVSNNGQGASAIVLTPPFQVSGAQASADVLVQAGHTYLLSIVAQVALRITTTDSAGRPVQVRNGNFDTWGSLSGFVREIWLDETVYIQ